jgi:hypothetical protein
MTNRSGLQPPQPHQPLTERPAPRRALWLLTLLVVLGHWLLLAAISSDAAVAPALQPLSPTKLVFNTRRIEVPSAQAVQAVRVAQAAPVRPPPVFIQQPTPSPQPEALLEPVIAPVVQAEAESEPAPEAAPEATAALSPAEPEPPLPEVPADSPLTTADNSAPEPSVNLAIPGSVQLKYKMTGLSGGLNYHASGVMTWLQDGSRYEARMVISAFLIGSRAMESQGKITADGLAPTLFTDKGRNPRTATFQADKGTINFSANTAEAPWKRGAQDRVTVFFQLASLLAGQPNGFPPGSKIPLYTVGPRDADTWTFTVGDEEVLDLPMGTVSAVKLTRDSRRESDQRIEAWFAPSLDFWPVRITITQAGGDYIDQQLSSSEPP